MIPMTEVAQATFINGATTGLTHGSYPNTLFTSMLTKLKLEPKTNWLIIYFPEFQPTDPLNYKTMSEIKNPPEIEEKKGSSIVQMGQLGGARMDVDYPEVATFGTYRSNRGRYNLDCWFDFDHWPGTGAGRDFHLIAGMSDGHYHTAPDTAPQTPCDGSHRELLLRVVTQVRSR